MSNFTNDDVVKALGNLTVMELVSLTKELEKKWGVKAEPQVTAVVVPDVKVENKKTEFDVVLSSYPADKKMGLIKLVRELTGLGLKEAKDFVESVPKKVKEAVSESEADELKRKLVEAGAVVEIK